MLWGKKLSCDSGLAGTPPAFSDHRPRDCPHRRSYCFYSRSNAAFWDTPTLLDEIVSSTLGILSSRCLRWRYVGSVKFPESFSRCGNLVAVIQFRNRSRKEVAPKTSLKVCLGARTTQCPSFLICCTIGTASNAQHPFTPKIVQPDPTLNDRQPAHRLANLC